MQNYSKLVLEILKEYYSFDKICYKQQNIKFDALWDWNEGKAARKEGIYPWRS